MIGLIITFTLAYLWLMYETRWLTVRLMPEIKRDKPAAYKVVNTLSNRKQAYGDLGKPDGANFDDSTIKDYAKYVIVLNPGIDSVLCGWDWLNQHCGNMVDYQPEVSIESESVRYKMVIKDHSIIKDVMKANKQTKPRDLYPVLPVLKRKPARRKLAAAMA